MNPFTQWLHERGLERYEPAFRDNDIDFGNARNLTEGDLKELGLSLGHRKNFMAAIAALDPSAPAATVGSTQPAEPIPALNPEPATPSGERRQLTVMFCDLVGSTALSEKLDPEELRSLLHDYRTRCGEVIGRYEGFVARYVGDGILTYFGWPTAHEDDAERSIRAALEISQTIQQASLTEKLSVRIGIATGPVVVGEQAGVGDQSKLAIGATPNLAARLQGLAAADQIVVSASTRRLIGNAFQLADLGEHELKGISEPVHAWRVVEVSEAASRFEASHGEQLTPLVGREQDLGLLLERWALAQDGEGQVVLLSGEPGIGKSRVLSAIRERLEAQGAQSLRFQCSPYYINSAYWPIIDNFERALKFARDEQPESKLDKLEALMVKEYGRPISDVRFIASILSIPYEDRYGAIAMTPEKHKDETLRTLADIMEGAAGRAPTVMLFEDLHWADPTTLEALDRLIDRTRTIALLIVLTHRPEFQSRWSQHGHVTSLNLSKLTRTQSAAMVSKLASSKSLPGDLLQQILNKTDGVPLYVEELTKSILESGELKEVGDHYDYASTTHHITVPNTLRDSLMARLDRYAPVKEIAQIGAAIGREFSYELIAAVVPMNEAQLADALVQLTESGLAFRKGTPPEAAYTFKHALVQDAAYDSLLKSRRQELHSKIAQAIEERFPQIKETEPELLAHHFTEAQCFEHAVPCWQRAGELAQKSVALQEAIRYYERGLSCVKALPPSVARDGYEFDLRAGLGTTWVGLQGWANPHTSEHLEAAWRLGGSLDRGDYTLRTLWGLWATRLTGGLPRESLTWTERTLALAEQRDDRRLFFVGHLTAATTHYFLGQFTHSIVHSDNILNRYDPMRDQGFAEFLNHDPKTVALAYKSASQWHLGYVDQAAATAEMTFIHSRSLAHPFDLCFALHFCGMQVFAYRRESERLRSLLGEFEQVSADQHLLFFQHVLVPVCHAIEQSISSGPQQIADAYAKIMPGYIAVGMLAEVPRFKAEQAMAIARLRNIVSAFQLIDEALEQIERPGSGERKALAEVLRTKGLILQMSGDERGAAEAFEQSLSLAREQAAKSWELRTSTSLAKLWQSQGKRKEALDLLKPVYDWFTEGFDTKDLKEARALLDSLQE